MPSINRTIAIHADRRIRINTCEGSVGITDEERTSGNRWHPMASINMTREQAKSLVDTLADQMAKHF